jgi:hypothetical protein
MTAALVRERLVTLGVASGTVAPGAAWVALEGGLSDAVAAPQVAALDTGGLPPLTAHSLGAPLRPGVQILIRGLPNTYTDTRAKTLAVWEALHYTRFPGVWHLEGVNNPIWLGYDDDRRPRWSINLTALTP